MFHKVLQDTEFLRIKRLMIQHVEFEHNGLERLVATWRRNPIVV